MEKSNNVTRLAIASVAAAAIFAATPIVGNTFSAKAESTANKTATISTSWGTRFTAPIDYVDHNTRVTSVGKGVSVEMDVLASDLKSEANVSYIKTHWKSPITANDLQAYLFSTAGVSFNFWRSSANLDKGFLWNGPTVENGNTQAFNYYADGRIVLTNYYTLSDGSTRNAYEVTSFDADGNLIWNADYINKIGSLSTYITGTAIRGDIEEVKTFMDAGYSYKVELYYGYVNEDLTLSDKKTSNGHFNPWYVAYKKAIGTEDWTACFAIPLNRNYMMGSATAGNCYAGFELMGNTRYAKTSMGAGKYSNNSKNLNMEIDNVAIYSSVPGATKNVITFDDANVDEFTLSEAESEAQSIGVAYSNAGGYNEGNPSKCGNGHQEYYNQYKYAQNNITVNSINAPMEKIGAPATRTLNTYYNVSYNVNGKTTTDMVAEADAAAYKLATAPTVEGRTFAGWLCNGQVYEAGATFALSSNTTLTAVFKPVLTIKYVDEAGNVQHTYTQEYAYGASYAVDSPVVAGYTVDKAKVEGTNLTENTTVTVTYTAIKVVLTINYVDTEDTVVATAYTQEYAYGASYAVDSPVVAGYTADKAKVEGTNLTENTTVTVTYTAIKPMLTINYVYEDNSVAATAYTQEYAYGASYAVDSPAIVGFTADKVKVEGTNLTEDITVTVTYKAIKPVLTINYVDTEGNAVATAYTQEYAYGASYAVDSPVIDGYTADKAKVEGTNLTEDMTITVTYTAIPKENTSVSALFAGCSASIGLTSLASLLTIAGALVVLKKRED